MRITAYGRRTDGYPYSGECFGVSGKWTGDDRGTRCFIARVVLDLGYDSDRIASRAVRGRDPDVIILTHDDGDHIGGALTALKALSWRPGRQVWLPAEWWYMVAAWAAAAGIVPTAGRPATPIEPEDLARVAEHDGELPGMVAVDGHESREGDRADQGELPDWLHEMPRERPAGIRADDIATVIAERGSAAGHSWGHEFSGDPTAVAKRVVRRSQRIVDIVQAAAKVAEIRWFAFDASINGTPRWTYVGIPGAVTLLNAREMAIPSAVIADPTAILLQAFRLSVQNRRALVTFVWPDAKARARRLGGFLGWSDSAGAGCDPSGSSYFTPWRCIGVMSAPHHASTARDAGGSYIHGGIWASRPARVGVLLCNNWRATICCYMGIPGFLRAATQLDGLTYGSRPYRAPVDARAVIRRRGWRLLGR